MSKLIVNNLSQVTNIDGEYHAVYWIISPPFERKKFNFIDKLIRIPWVKHKNKLPKKGWVLNPSHENEYGYLTWDQLIFQQ